jgi:hypothetical protein
MPPTEASPQRGLRRLSNRRVRAWFHLLVGVPLLALLALLALAGSPAGNRWLMLRAVEGADLLLPHASLRIGDLHTDVLRRVVISKLELVADDGDSLVTVRSVELEWRPLALLRGELYVERVVLREPWVDLEVDPEGRVDLLEALGLGGEESDPDGGPWEGLPIDVHVERVNIQDARIGAALETTEGPASTWQLADLDLALGFELQGRELAIQRAVLAGQLRRWVGDAEPSGLPLGISGDLRLVNDPAGFPMQALQVEDLRLSLGSAVLGAEGALLGLGGDPRLDLGVALRDLHPGELAFLTGDLGVAGPFGLEAQASGPMDALELQASLDCPDGAGALRLGLGANLLAEQPVWKLHVRLDAVQPHRFVEALPEPFLLHGGLLAEGTGLSWPDGLEAELGLALEPGLAWGVGLDGLSVQASAADGQLLIQRAAFTSELGRGTLEGGFDPAEMALALRFGLSGLPLARLDAFGVPDLGGSARAFGAATVQLGGEAVAVAVDGRVRVDAAGYGGLVRARQLGSPVGLSWSEGALRAEGVLDATGVEGAGATVGHAQGPWRFDLHPDGAMDWSAQLVAAGLGYGVLTIAEARSALVGGIPVAGGPQLELDFDATGIEAPSSVAPELGAERAAGKLVIEGDRLELVAQARDGEREVLRTQLFLDMASGDLELPTLLVAPTEATTWRAVEPVKARIVDGGVRGLRLQLRSGDALLWGMGNFDPSGPLDLRLMVSDLTLDPLVPIFPGLPRGLQGTTRVALQVTGDVDAVQLAGSAEVEDLVVPGSVRDLDARLVISGDGRRFRLQLEVPEPDPLPLGGSGPPRPGDEPEQAAAKPAWASASMLFLRGDLPLAVSAAGVSLDQQSPWELDVLLAPGELERFAERFVLEDLPEARLSAHARVGGSPADSRVDLTAATELPVGEDQQRVRLELDLHQRGALAELELVVAQHMLRQAELVATLDTSLPVLIQQRAGALFGAPVDPRLVLDPVLPSSWVSELEASLVPLGIDTELLAQLAPIPERVSGAVVGGLRISGDPMRPALSGALQLVDGRLGDVGVAPALVTVMPAEGGYDLGVNLGFSLGGGLQLSGFAPLELALDDLEASQASLARDGLDLRIGGDGLPLEALLALAAEVEEVEGVIELAGRVRGSVLDPKAELSVSMEGGSVTLPQLGIRYQDLLIDASVDGKLVQLDELRVSAEPAYGVGVAGGSLELVGSGMLDGWVPDAVELRGRAEHFWAIDTLQNRLCFSGDFGATGRWPALDISGDIEVADARFVLDRNMFLYSGTLDLDPRLSIQRQGMQPVAEPEVLRPFYQDMSVDLRLDLARSAAVQVEMPFDDTLGAVWASALTIAIETRVDGQLAVRLDDGELGLLGEVEPTWGRADILGARFALGEGTITFAGGDPFDPILNLEAVHSTARYGDVAVDITGSLADMGLAFRSDDYPDETDIVSILLMGAPLSELDGNGGTPGGALFGAALGAVVGELESQGSGTHLVDMVELDSESVKLGRAFGDDIFVTLEREPGAEVDEGENITEITVDWTITRAWNAEFVTGDQGASSADLYWTWRF